MVARPCRYAIALGSNRRHGRHGAPVNVVRAALTALRADGIVVERVSPIITTAAFGPAGRAFANGAAIIATPLDPPGLLAALKRIERTFGRRRGRRWGARVLDLDILLWSGGRWRDPRLTVPHTALEQRRFVLDPLVAIAPRWRLPDGGTVVQARMRLLRRKRMDDAPAPAL